MHRQIKIEDRLAELNANLVLLEGHEGFLVESLRAAVVEEMVNLYAERKQIREDIKRTQDTFWRR